MRHTAPHALADHPLPGIDPTRLAALRQEGIDSLEAVVDAGPDRLRHLTGFDRKTCVALVRVAESALLRAAPASGAPERPRVEAPIERLARGLEAARMVEGVLGLVRKARSHVGKRPPRPRDAADHKKARKQLARLAGTLALVQEELLSDGVSEQTLAHLRGQLAPLDEALRALLQRPPKRRMLRRTRKVAKRARKELDGSRLR